MLTEQQSKVRHYKSGRNALSSFNYVLQSVSCNLQAVRMLKGVWTTSALPGSHLRRSSFELVTLCRRGMQSCSHVYSHSCCTDLSGHRDILCQSTETKHTNLDKTYKLISMYMCVYASYTYLIYNCIYEIRRINVGKYNKMWDKMVLKYDYQTNLIPCLGI